MFGGIGLGLISGLIFSGLYFMIYRKAGFSGVILAVCFTPLLNTVLPFLMVSMSMGGGYSMGFAFLSITLTILAILPLALLAFLDWPIRATLSATSETDQ